jgi:hypothetical protein
MMLVPVRYQPADSTTPWHSPGDVAVSACDYQQVLVDQNFTLCVQHHQNQSHRHRTEYASQAASSTLMAAVCSRPARCARCGYNCWHFGFFKAVATVCS